MEDGKGHKSQQRRRRSKDHSFLMMVFSSKSVLLLLTNALCFCKASNETVPLFGTQNGYDVGGTDPICWSSKFRGLQPAAAKNATGKGNDIEQLNELTFGNNAEVSDDLGQLLPSCYNGIRMSLEPLSSSLRQIFIGQDFTFELVVEADLKQLEIYSNTNSIEDFVGTKSTIHVRLQLCDALKQGFCNPLRDTRAQDSVLTRNETDVPPASIDGPFEYPEGANKWAYTEGDVLVGIPDRTVVAARWCKWALRPVTSNDTETMLYRAAFNITLRLPEVREGAYFFIGHSVLNFAANENLERIDIAQAIPNYVVEVRHPPLVLRVSSNVRIGLLFVITVTGAMAFAMLVATIVYRNHNVMLISQGPFLSAMSLLGLIQIVATYTAIPLNSIICNINGSALLIPMTTLGAILVGRIWRVYTALSRISSLGRRKSGSELRAKCGDSIITFLDLLGSIPYRLCYQPTRPRATSSAGIRQVVGTVQTASVAFFLTLPQIVFQCLSLIIKRRQLITEFNSTGDTGREVCNARPLPGVGLLLMVAVYLVAIWMTWRSRHLPSAFREKDQIFAASSLSAMICVVSLSVMGLVNNPAVSPDVQVMLFAFLSIGSATTVLCFLVWPKIQRVLSGEVVVMSQLLESQHGHSVTSSVSSVERYSPSEDPLPAFMEEGMISVQNLLRDVKHTLDDGKLIEDEDWSHLRSKIDELCLSLSRFDEVKDSPKENAASRHEL